MVVPWTKEGSMSERKSTVSCDDSRPPNTDCPARQPGGHGGACGRGAWTQRTRATRTTPEGVSPSVPSGTPSSSSWRTWASGPMVRHWTGSTTTETMSRETAAGRTPVCSVRTKGEGRPEWLTATLTGRMWHEVFATLATKSVRCEHLDHLATPSRTTDRTACRSGPA